MSWTRSAERLLAAGDRGEFLDIEGAQRVGANIAERRELSQRDEDFLLALTLQKQDAVVGAGGPELREHFHACGFDLLPPGGRALRGLLEVARSLVGEGEERKIGRWFHGGFGCCAHTPPIGRVRL